MTSIVEITCPEKKKIHLLSGKELVVLCIRNVHAF